MGALTLAVTGATGFLGRHVVAEAVARGHRVVALSRGAASWPAGVEGRRADLAVEAPDLTGCDALVHAAAALGGSEAEMARDTVRATERTLDACARAGVRRVALASSLSVYAAGPPGGAIDESSALEDRPDLRDAYARAKLAQEARARAWAEGPGRELWVLRIGALFGPGRLWNGHLGVRLGPVTLRLGSGPIPVAWVVHAAGACVRAAEAPGGGIVNVVDDDLPDARRFLAAVGAGAQVPVPWRALDVLARGGAGAPGLMRRPTLRARMMPRAWPNAALHALGWAPSEAFEGAVARSRGTGA